MKNRRNQPSARGTSTDEGHAGAGPSKRRSRARGWNKNLVALFAGLLFAVGLGVSGMTDPSKVRAFLDVGGAWDPSLAFVMVGAIGVHFAFAQRAKKKPVTLSGEPIALPTKSAIDAPLLVGAALFGIGWGIAGFCPGPALVSFAGGTSTSVVAFVGAMVVGALVMRRLRPPATASSAGRANDRAS